MKICGAKSLIITTLPHTALLDVCFTLIPPTQSSCHPLPHIHMHTQTDDWTPSNPAAAQTTLSPASYSQPVANSFRQAWERAVSKQDLPPELPGQAGQTGAQARKRALCLRACGLLLIPSPPHHPIRASLYFSASLCSLHTCPGLWSVYVLRTDTVLCTSIPTCSFLPQFHSIL